MRSIDILTTVIVHIHARGKVANVDTIVKVGQHGRVVGSIKVSWVSHKLNT